MINKIKLRKILFVIVILLIIFYILLKTNIINVGKIEEYVLKQMYGEPIDLTTGIINNNYFKIKMDGTDSENTTKGINKAIKYASKNNIEYIKLEKGTYLVQGEKYDGTDRGVQLSSNITLDLNNSIVRHRQNSQPGYVILNIENAQNVKIINGVLIGDRKEHDYDTIPSKHEWGMAIQILGSQNIEINNLEIYNMTGDGIYLSEATDGKSNDIIIRNNNIYDCKRQGISIITSDNVIISDNEIHEISGCGIDFERNFETQTCYNIKVYDNKFYNINVPKYAIFVHDGIKQLDIFKNELYDAKIQVSYPNDTIKVYDNKITK